MGPDSEALEAFLMSPQQRRLFKVSRGEPGYASSCLLRIDGPLAAGRVEAALAAAVERHEILRTALRRPAGLGVPAQVIVPDRRPRLATRDLGDLPPGERESGLAERLTALRETAFDPEDPPLLVAELVRLDDQRHALALVLSAFVADGRALDNLVAEIAAELSGASVPADGAEPMQYADFSEWLKGFDGEDGEEGRDYWRVRGVPLPLEAPPPLTAATEPFAPAEVAWRRDEEGALRLEAHAESLGAGLGDLLLAAWAALLGSGAGSGDLVIGHLAQGRRYEPLERALGLYARYLPLVCTLSGETPFADLVHQVRDGVARDVARQEQFSWEAVGAEAAETPVFPVAFSMERSEDPPPAGSLQLAVASRRSWVDRLGIELSAVRRPGAGLGLAVRYDAGRLPAATAADLAARLDALLDRAAAGGNPTVDALRRAGAAAALVAVVPSDDPARPPVRETLQTRFAERVARSAADVALVTGDAEVTYAELGHRAGSVARRLAGAGVRPGAVVGVLAERSVDAVTGLLGVACAGATWIYLDPGLPDARLSLLLADAAPRVVLCGGSHRARLDALAVTTETVPIETDEEASTDMPLQVVAGDPDLPAYVVYTSGSTGEPKGTVAPHRAVLGHLDFVAASNGLGADDVVLQLASLSFDASVRDLILPLLLGARVVLLDPERAKDPREMLLAIRRHGVDRLLAVVPTVLRALVAAAEREAGGEALRTVRPVRTILTSGERLLGEDCRRTRAVFGDAVEIVNQYGPTECTMTSSRRDVPNDARWEEIPLGRPAWGARFHLLDARLDPVIDGWPGELHIAGAGLGWGYVGRPGLTAERFVPEASGGAPGSRMYRTGDRARRSGDGELEFLGRLDDQLKVRGVRVEPGEIEAVLGGCEAVRQAVVAGRPAADGSVRLVAYVVAREEEVAAASARALEAELLDHLRRTLPEPLVPSDLVLIPRLPQTRTGKVDRGALPAPETLRPEEPVAPEAHDPVRETVAAIWADLLGRERVGAHESFFSLGGHSLLATQAMARLRDALGVQIPLQAAFEAPTPAAMAERVRQASTGDGLPPLVPVTRSGPLPLSFSQERHWFLHAREPSSPLFNNAGGLRFRGRLDVRALAEALRALVRRHEVLRTGFPAVDGEPVQAIEPAVGIDLPLVDLTGLPDEARERQASRWVWACALRPFDLARPPLLRMVLLRVRPDEHRAAVALHHIVSDLWSVGVFIDDLVALYQAATEGRAADLPEMPLQYADFAAWQREWLRGDVLGRLLDFWKAELPAGGRTQSLFPERSGEAAEEPGRRHPFAVPAELAGRLRELGGEEGATLFMTLFAGFQVLLQHLTGVDDLVVGAPIANRNLTETEGMIGCFINALALRTRLDDDPSFRALLGRVRKSLLAAYTHQDLPFEKLVEELRPDRARSRWPLFQVTFNFQNEPIGERRLPGLVVEDFDVEGGMPVKYDLGLYLTDAEGDLPGALGYSPALFEPGTVADLCASFVDLLALCAERPDATVGELRVALSEAERTRREASREERMENRRRSLGRAKRRVVQR